MIPHIPEGTVAVLSTVGVDGPHAIPVSALHAPGDDRVLVALAPSRGSLARLRASPRVALAIIAPGVAVTLRGAARIVAEPLPGAEFVVAIEVVAEAVDDALTPRTEIDAGVVWHWTDAADAARDAEVRSALAQLAAN